MPPRYKQGQLASQVVGTPGLDRSAGQAELAVAETMDRMSAQAHAMQMSNLQRADASFQQAQNTFAYYGAQRAAEQRRAAAIAKAEADEERRLNVQVDRLAEDDRMDAVVSDLKTKFADNPDGAVTAFNQQIPKMRQDFAARYSEDEKRLRMLMPSQRGVENTAQKELTNWAKQTNRANLEKRLMLLPQELGQKIDSLEGTIPEQLLKFQKKLIGTDSIYEDMANRAVTEADKMEITGKRINMGNEAGKRFVDHLFAQVPQGEAGLQHLTAMRDIVTNSSKYGIPLESKEKASFLTQLHSEYNTHENDVIIGIKSDNEVKLLDTNRLKADLIAAANNPAELNRLAKIVDARFTQLDKEIALVSKEPDSKIKNAKLAGLKAQQNSMISEMGLDLKLVRSFEQLQRSLTSFAQSQIRFAQSQISFNQGQLRFAQGQADREERQAWKQQEEKIAAQKDSFNNKWGAMQRDLMAAWGQPDGVSQQRAVKAVVDQALPELNNALTKGIISPETYKARLAQIEKQSVEAAKFGTSKPWLQFGDFKLGGGQPKILKGKELQEAQTKAKRQMGQAVSEHIGGFRQVESALSQMKTLTTNKTERAALNEYISTHMPAFVDKASFKALPPAEQDKRISKIVRQTVEQYRKGTLR